MRRRWRRGARAGPCSDLTVVPASAHHVPAAQRTVEPLIVHAVVGIVRALDALSAVPGFSRVRR